MAVVAAQRELFEIMNVAISIASNASVPVDNKLLGL